MIWSPIKNNDRYEVSSCGQVRKSINLSHPERSKKFIVLKQWTDRDSYKHITINKKNHLVHRLVFEAYNGPLIDGLVVCHANGVRDDNRAENLIQTTQRINISHKRDHGTWQSAEKHPRSLIDNELARIIKNEIKICEKSKTGRMKRGAAKELSDKFGLSINVIYYISHGGYADA